MIELSGLHGVWLGTKHPIGSRITLYYINGSPTQTIDYESGQWVQAEKDRKSIEDALGPRHAVEQSKGPMRDGTPRERLL
jgi:hypothetical protein